ncbi:MAG: 4Fe-4S binding protein [Duncaniella sp.]|nr:4Fe-4S binding protein [Duncaniella sp.]
MGRLLKILRVVVESVIFGLLTYSTVRVTSSFAPVASFLSEIQFIPATVTFSMTIILSWLVITLLLGRIYCSTVCPLAAVQDAAARVSITARGRKWKGYTYFRPQNLLRYISLGVVFFALVCGFTAILLIFDPFTIYERTIAGVSGGNSMLSAPVKAGAAGTAGFIIAFTVLAAISVFAAAGGRTFCNTLCPAGTTLSFVARYSIFHIDINPDKCIQCRRCERVCKAHCIDVPAHTVDSSRCVVCFNCVTGCPNDAIRYTSDRHRLSYPLMQSIDGAIASASATPDTDGEAVTSVTDNIPTDENIS